MKVVIFGATGKTGIEIVKQALARDHEVTAFVRGHARIGFNSGKISVEDRVLYVNGDVFDLSSVKQAVHGQEAVICALGSNSLTKTTVRGEGTTNIVKAMEEEHVDRLIIVSAMGTGESWSDLSLINKFFYATLLRSSRRDHEAQEAVVKNSSLIWTIMRPSGLTDGALTGRYAIGEGVLGESSRISRADVASAVIKELDDGDFIRRSPTISN